MRKKLRNVSLIFIMVMAIQILFAIPVFAESKITKDSSLSVDKNKLVMKIQDERIKAATVNNIYITVGPEKETNYTEVRGIAEIENQKGAVPKVVSRDGFFYRVYDGYVQWEIGSGTGVARILGTNTRSLSVTIELTDKQSFKIEGEITGIFEKTSETPSEGDKDEDKYLFRDYKYTHSDTGNGGHWAYDCVKKLKELDIVRGTTEGYLFPDARVNLKEFIAMLSRTLQYMDVADDKDFTKVFGTGYIDDYNKWVKDDYAILMNALGIISEETKDKGQTELKKIQSDTLGVNVTREDAASLIAAFLGDSSNTDNPNNFKDWDKVNKKGRVARLCEYGVMYGTEKSDGIYVEPTSEITRIQAMMLLGKLIEIKDDVEVEPGSETAYKPKTSDTTKPVIEFVPNGGKIKPEATVKVNIKENESNITIVRYAWDNNVATSKEDINKKEYTLSVEAPKTGKHVLRVWARNEATLATGWKTVTYEIDVNAKDVDKTPPEINFYIGDKAVGIFSTIDKNATTCTIKATDPESGVKQIKYYWDSDLETVVNSDSVTVDLPDNTDVIHYLYVEAQNSVGLWAEKSVQYKELGKDYNNDDTAPEVTINTSLDKISTKDNILITAKDIETGVAKITYHWDSNAETVLKCSNALDVTIVAKDTPQTEGIHKLYVKAENGEGDVSKEQVYQFTIVKSNSPLIPGTQIDYDNDTTAPNVTIDTTKTTLAMADVVKATVYDNESGITQITYRWDSNASKTIVADVIKTTIEIDVPNVTGQHTLYIKALNGKGIWSQEVSKTYTIDENASDDDVVDTTSPEISINTTLTEISTKDIIKITAKDNDSGVGKVEYKWNNNSWTEIDCKGAYEIIIPVNAPKTVGDYKLYIKATDKKGNIADKNYSFEVISSKYPLIDDELDYENDKTPPVVSIDRTNENVSMKDKIMITAYDNESGISQIVYRWDSNSEVVIPITAVKMTMKIPVPQTKGSHYLYVKAKNGANNPVWSQEILKMFNVASEGYEEDDDSTSPEISINTNLTEISTKDTIKVTVRDNGSGIAKVQYKWNSQSWVEIDCRGAEEVVIPVDAPKNIGDYKLYIKATDRKNNVEDKNYSFDVISSKYPLIDDDELDYENDRTPPVVSIDTTQERLSTKDKVKITAYDNESGISQIVYRWDSETEVVIPVNVLKMSIKIPVPQKVGNHYLYVKAKNDAKSPVWSQEILKMYEIIESDKPLIEDEIDSPVRIIIDGDEDDGNFNNGDRGNVVEPETPIIITGDKPDEIEQIGYHWNNEKEKIVDKSEVQIKVPDEVGIHYLYVRIKNKKGEWSPVRKYKFEVMKDIDNVRLEEVVVIVKDKKSGDLVLSKTRDWEDVEDGKITYKAPTKEGTYVLYVRVMNNKGNIFEAREAEFTVEKAKDDENEKTKNLVVKAKLPKSDLNVYLTRDGKEAKDAGMETYPGNPELRGLINPAITNLRVEIRNADDKIMFNPDEEIKYYIDFYNGSTAEIEDVKITFFVPEGFKVVSASDDGEISNSEVTWDIGDVKEKGGNRYNVVIKYNGTLVEDLYVTPEVNITIKDKVEDLSFAYNMLYKEGTSSEGYHSKYVVGYPDGSFKPEGTITRAEMAAMFAKLFELNSYGGSSFNDLSYDHWANPAINGCVGAGLITTYGDYFDPDTPASRSVFAIGLATYLNVANIEPIFINANDTEGHYAMKSMEQLMRLGLMKGYPDGSAGVNNLVTRAEAVTLLNKYAFRGGLTLSNYSNYGNSSYIFTDLGNGHWALNHILEAALDHSYVRTINGEEKSY